MERFRKKLAGRIALLEFWMFAAIALCMANMFRCFWWTLISRTRYSFWVPFAAREQRVLLDVAAGIFLGVGIIALTRIVRIAKALGSENRLRLLYNEEYDERRILIRQKSGMPMLTIISVCMLFVGNIVGLFSGFLVFETLTAVAVAQLLIGTGAKLYFTRTLSGREDTEGKPGART